MAISNIVKDVKHKFKAFKGKKLKEKLYPIENEFQDVNQAEAAFIESRQKLLNVTGWSFMEGINSVFTLHDHSENRFRKGKNRLFYQN